MYNNKSENTQIRNLYAPGFSALSMSYFRTYLTLKFVPWISRDSTGHSQYCRETFLSTSVNPEGAAYFYLAAMSILDGKDSDKQIQAALPCSNNTTLTLEYMPDENNQMTAYMIINKDTQTIPFRFKAIQKQVMIDGQMVTKVIQVGLGVFAKTLNGYLKGIGANNHLNKLTNEQLDPEQTPAPME